MKDDAPRLAVLIDADNVKISTITPLLSEIAQYGRITTRRIYGDFTSNNLAGWRAVIAEHAIQPIQQYRNTIGKNASDSALIIDAMDMLHSRRFDGFCIVSSDSDFTRLAARIREDGLMVYGFGERKTPKSFVSACDKFIYVEILSTTSEIKPGSSKKKPKSPQQKQVDPIRDVLARAAQSAAGEDGWAQLGKVGQLVSASQPDFDPRNYGFGKLRQLIESFGDFQLETRAHGAGQSLFIRLRDSSSPSTPVTPAASSAPNATPAAAANGERRDERKRRKGRNRRDEAASSLMATAAPAEETPSAPAVEAPAAAPASRPLQQELHDLLQHAVQQSLSADGAALLGSIGQQLRKLKPDFNIRSYDYATLTQALADSGLFSLSGKGAALRVRLK
ncbi:NYN domain-containing protein [Leeia aquatica]|uniref:NYN domain-containing protein n=1 Tax=Leeia aquatica TaxID=2725557 RepID=A0A847S7N4_9NEIS|nr:NYN domain-containing protein [Leeia aquatica]NLR74865.1 NYN domain-containing protein [Leeia aquatica]